MNELQRVILLLIPLVFTGCGMSNPSSPASSTPSRFMEVWNIYSHCAESEDLDAMRVDAERLNVAVEVMIPPAKPIFPEGENREPMESPARLSADPAALAAACGLRTGQLAEEKGRLSLAREMFQKIVTNFPHPRYSYYATQAREGLERLDTGKGLSGLFGLSGVT